MSGLLPFEAVEALQDWMVSVGALPDTCVIQTRTSIADEGGGRQITYTDSAPVPCRVMPEGAQPREGTAGDAVIETNRYVITLRVRETVHAKDRIKVGTRVFEAQASGLPKSWAIVQNVPCLEIA